MPWRKEKHMKKGIHPESKEITITCACGHSFKANSTAGKDLHVETCIHCHPYTTGKNKTSKAGRVDKFNEKYNIKEEN